MSGHTKPSAWQGAAIAAAKQLKTLREVATKRNGSTVIDDDPLRTATYLRGLRNGMEDAAKLCETLAVKFAQLDTATARIRSAGAASAAFHIRKALAKVPTQ